MLGTRGTRIRNTFLCTGKNPDQGKNRGKIPNIPKQCFRKQDARKIRVSDSVEVSIYIIPERLTCGSKEELQKIEDRDFTSENDER